jgi:hypothetical protein
MWSVLASFAPVVGIIVAVNIFSGPIGFAAMLSVFVIGAVAATLPFFWLFARYVPLVAKDA